MPDPIISIERLVREARDAALRYSDVNAACPYPFASDAGSRFRAEFNAARAEITAAPKPTKGTQP